VSVVASDGSVRRFTASDRVEHWVQMGSFTVLAITGIVQRYNGVWPSRTTIDLLGGIESVRIIHRVFATILMIAVVYHFGSVGFRKYVLREPRRMVPGREDAAAITQSVGYAFGIRREPPRQGRFTWEEKVEYWAFVWGTLVMVITGFLLWNPIATTRILPGQFIPAAKAAHGGEAVLAILAIIAWHVYHVHVKHFNKSMFTGYLSREEMEELHPLELEEIESGSYRRPPADEIMRRTRLFLPVYGVFAVVLLIGIYFFISFENTAIETIAPAEQVDVFAPVETTTPAPPTTAAPVDTTTTTVPAETTTTVVAAAPTWASISGLFEPACTSCHGPQSATGGLDLSSYATAVAGGGSGAGIVPGDPGASVIVQVMEAGGHPVNLDTDQISLLSEWIAAGAPEAGDGPTPSTVVDVSAGTWADPVSAFFRPACTVCHGSDQRLGGLSLASYGGAVSGGESGAGIVPGDPGASVIVQIMEARGHPALLTQDQLAALRAWITAGAPEA